jgi:hypothetical protein
MTATPKQPCLTCKQSTRRRDASGLALCHPCGGVIYRDPRECIDCPAVHMRASERCADCAYEHKIWRVGENRNTRRQLRCRGCSSPTTHRCEGVPTCCKCERKAVAA